MPPTREQVDTVEAALREIFPNADVQSRDIFDREVWLFRARDAKAPAPAYELEIAYEAFEHDRSPEITTILGGHALDLFRDQPHRRQLIDSELNLGFRM
jgi:hypothetical protein